MNKTGEAEEERRRRGGRGEWGGGWRCRRQSQIGWTAGSEEPAAEASKSLEAGVVQESHGFSGIRSKRSVLK